MLSRIPDRSVIRHGTLTGPGVNVGP
jgi:hypothetical protein